MANFPLQTVITVSIATTLFLASSSFGGLCHCENVPKGGCSKNGTVMCPPTMGDPNDTLCMTLSPRNYSFDYSKAFRYCPFVGSTVGCGWKKDLNNSELIVGEPEGRKTVLEKERPGEAWVCVCQGELCNMMESSASKLTTTTIVNILGKIKGPVPFFLLFHLILGLSPCFSSKDSS